jgi:peroxiredoxin Q/BCP
LLKIGQKSPNFSLPRDGEGTLNLADYKGQALVIFFYPKDDTSGCTKEAIEFTQLSDTFKTIGANIVGVSKDTVAKHDKFVAKYYLKIPLLSDTTGQMCESFGVWKEKSMYGRTYMGIERTTFLIDAEGVICALWNKVRVKGHAEAVLEAMKKL